MRQKKQLLNYNESPVFNALVHVGMAVKIFVAIGMIFGIWYYL